MQSPGGHASDDASCHVMLEVFEGPLDLLLHLIKKSEIDIYDIPIVDITHQYNAYLAKLEALNLNIAGEFLLMASTLVQIKSRMLLPKRESLDGEEDPREELVRQLVEHQLIKELASSFHDMSERRAGRFASGHGFAKEVLEEGGLVVEASVFDLISCYRQLCERMQVRTDLSLARARVNVGDQIKFLLGELNLFRVLSLGDIFSRLSGRMEWIVTFLALLELVRLKYIKVYQSDAYGGVRLVRNFEVLDGESIERLAARF